MAGLVIELREKIRALTEDFHKNGVETFTYTVSSIFTLQENYPDNVTSITKNGIALASGDYSFDSTTNQVTISASLTSGDIIVIKYTYYKYSNSELDEYIRASLTWISILAYCKTDYEFENDDIYPTPDSRTEDLIAIIASILINPNYTEYRLPNLTVKYPQAMSKEEKIYKTISRFQIGLGIFDIIEFD